VHCLLCFKGSTVGNLRVRQIHNSTEDLRFVQFTVYKIPVRTPKQMYVSSPLEQFRKMVLNKFLKVYKEAIK
jgi:hypothetical protein